MLRYVLKIQLFIFIIVSLEGCLSVKEVYKSALSDDKKTIDYKTTFIVKTDKSGKDHGFLTTSLLPSIRFEGDVTTDLSGDMVFNINNTYFFTNSSRTYSEGEISTYGKIVWHNSDGGVVPLVKEKIEFIEVTKGETRNNDLYYRGTKGLEKIKNKFERVKETTIYLKSRQDFPEYFGKNDKANYFFSTNREAGEGFYYKIKRILFPELYGIKNLYDRGLLDPSYDISKLDTTGDIVIGDDVAYRKSYSDTVITKILREQRNNGTLLCDFNESFEFIEAIYNMDYFFDKHLADTVFIEKR